jgi:hypothetical protein
MKRIRLVVTEYIDEKTREKYYVVNSPDVK